MTSAGGISDSTHCYSDRMRLELPLCSRFLAGGALLLAACCAFWTLAPWAQAANDARQVRIAYGQVGGFDWDIFTGREGRQARPQRPCVSAALRDGATGESTRLRACGSVDDSSVIVANSLGSKNEEGTVLAMAFTPQAVNARLWLRGRGTRNVKLKRLGLQQAVDAGLIRYRYAALDFAGLYCLKRFAIFDSRGTLLERSRNLGCHDS